MVRECPGGPRRAQEAPGRPRTSQKASGGPRRLQDAPGMPRRPEEAPGRPRRPQEAPEGPRRPQEATGGPCGSNPRKPQEATGSPRKAPGGPRRPQGLEPEGAPGGPRKPQKATGRPQEGPRRPQEAPVARTRDVLRTIPIDCPSPPPNVRDLDAPIDSPKRAETGLRVSELIRILSSSWLSAPNVRRSPARGNQVQAQLELKIQISSGRSWTPLAGLFAKQRRE